MKKSLKFFLSLNSIFAFGIILNSEPSFALKQNEAWCRGAADSCRVWQDCNNPNPPYCSSGWVTFSGHEAFAPALN